MIDLWQFIGGRLLRRSGTARTVQPSASERRARPRPRKHAGETCPGRLFGSGVRLRLLSTAVDRPRSSSPSSAVIEFGEARERLGDGVSEQALRATPLPIAVCARREVHPRRRAKPQRVLQRCDHELCD
jgi:hypothetical protein